MLRRTLTRVAIAAAAVIAVANTVAPWGVSVPNPWGV